MKRRSRVEHCFVEVIPERLEEGVLYVSMKYATAVHSCLCGCGSEIIMPLSPTDWQLAFDGVSVSLKPSVGNWSYPCQSHYWIVENEVRWSRKMSRRAIELGRERARRVKAEAGPTLIDRAAATEAGRGSRVRRFPRRIWPITPASRK